MSRKSPSAKLQDSGSLSQLALVYGFACFENASRKVNKQMQTARTRFPGFRQIGKRANFSSSMSVCLQKASVLQFLKLLRVFSLDIWLPVVYFRLLNRQGNFSYGFKADGRVQLSLAWPSKTDNCLASTTSWISGCSGSFSRRKFLLLIQSRTYSLHTCISIKQTVSMYNL